jgi:hypothetical protein
MFLNATLHVKSIEDLHRPQVKKRSAQTLKKTWTEKELRIALKNMESFVRSEKTYMSRKSSRNRLCWGNDRIEILRMAIEGDCTP